MGSARVGVGRGGGRGGFEVLRDGRLKGMEGLLSSAQHFVGTAGLLLIRKINRGMRG